MRDIIQKQLTTPIKSWRNSSAVFWFALSLTFAVIYAYLGGLRLAFADDYIIQDDGRQHVYWMMRYVDPELFPNDLISDYFQSVAPLGYTSLYKFAVFIGIDPITFSKILPLLLGLIATGYIFGVTLEILPIPITGFFAASLLNQNLWMDDNLASATPRAFLAPLFLAFIYYLLRRSLICCLIAIALLGLFYPTYALVAAGVIVVRLITWRDGKLQLTDNKKDYWICGTGLGVIFIILLPFALNVSEFSPVISLEQAKELPEFYPQGRSTFFWDNPWLYWLGGRSGMFSEKIFLSPLLLLGILLPILIRFPDTFPLVKQLKPTTEIFVQIIIACLSLFFAAHILLFRLHLPSRYTQYSLPIILAIAGAIAITVLFNHYYYLIQQKQTSWRTKFIPATIIIVLSLLIFLYPGIVKIFPQANYIRGNHTELYTFFAQQPKDITIASLTEETDNIPTFAQRTALTTRETAIPYHLGFYKPFRQRVMDTITAQYSPDLEVLKDFNQKYNIDYWLLKSEALEVSYITPPEINSIFDFLSSNHKGWLQQHQPTIEEARETLAAGKIPALVKVAKNCTIFDDSYYFVVESDCIRNYPKF